MYFECTGGVYEMSDEGGEVRVEMGVFRVGMRSVHTCR